MMKYTLLLVCSYLLILGRKGEAAECPSLSPKELDRLMELVVKEDVHKELVGSSQDLYGAKAFWARDPNTCIKHTRTFFDDTVLNQTVVARGKWFGAVDHVRQGYLMKVENNVYLEVLPDHKNFTHPSCTNPLPIFSPATSPTLDHHVGTFRSSPFLLQVKLQPRRATPRVSALETVTVDGSVVAMVYIDSLDIELAKVYVLYAKNGVFAYFWCMVFDPPYDSERPHLSRLSGVTVHPDEINDPKIKANVEEAVKKLSSAC